MITKTMFIFYIWKSLFFICRPFLHLSVIPVHYYITVFVIFVCTEEAVQRVKCEKTAEQAVLKVEVKTEVEEDRNQLEHEVRVSCFDSAFSNLEVLWS
jgi:hypothetical protein